MFSLFIVQAYKASTKYAPFFVMYGYEAILPINITQPKPEKDDTTQELTLDERLKKMTAFQKEIHDKTYNYVVRHKRSRSNGMMPNTMEELSWR